MNNNDNENDWELEQWISLDRGGKMIGILQCEWIF
jgi:hypothetical protein